MKHSREHDFLHHRHTRSLRWSRNSASRFLQGRSALIAMLMLFWTCAAVAQQSPTKASPANSDASSTATKSKSPGAIPPMRFADTPKFAVAGMTDWTAVGGHGSDSILRTSEALARDTFQSTTEKDPTVSVLSSEEEGALLATILKNPSNAEANHALGVFLLTHGKSSQALPLLLRAQELDPTSYQYAYDLARVSFACGNFQSALRLTNKWLAIRPTADLHRLKGEIDEKQGDPVGAVHEYQQAASIDPSEQNYFQWGSELLYHRAIWQALEVFSQGAKKYPASSRMLTALASAQFAGARYDTAAENFCRASDLEPDNEETYLLMGKVELASPTPLPCVQTRLQRFAQAHPENSTANYLHAMSILKGHALSENTPETQQATVLLRKAADLDHSCGEAFLQLGILAYAAHDLQRAIAYYKQAIAAKPQLADSYYRLGVAYDHLGQTSQARQEFKLHDEIVAEQAKAIDQERRSIKQFIVVQGGQTAMSHPH